MKFLTLPNGRQMPIIGLGCSVFPEDPKVIEEMIPLSIPIGYRLFDTASLYRTEKHLGIALNRILEKGDATRDEIFVVTKLPQIGMRPELVELFVQKSLNDLSLDYIDLYLIHWPIGMEFKGEDNFMPADPASKQLLYDNGTKLEEIWKVMESQVKAGRIKAIGLSNFNEGQIKRILKIAEIPPANLQIEMHAYLQEPNLRGFCEKHGITVTAYYPLGGQARNNYPKDWKITEAVPLLDDPVVEEIANKYGKSKAQVLLRFLTQLNVAVIPKSSKEHRLKENFDILNFELDEKDLEKMKKLDKGDSARSCFGLPGCETHPEYPFSFTGNKIPQ